MDQLPLIERWVCRIVGLSDPETVQRLQGAINDEYRLLREIFGIPLFRPRSSIPREKPG